MAVQSIATTRHIPLNKAENIEKFIQSALGKPNPVLISAYVPDTRRTQIFSARPTPSTYYNVQKDSAYSHWDIC